MSEDISTINPENLKYGELQAETEIGETEPVFPRIDKNKVMNEIMENEKVEETKKDLVEGSSVAPAAVDPANAETEEKPLEENFITIDDFLKVELRVGEVKVCERIPNADKLLRFEIDLGEENPRQILAGLAEYYEPEYFDRSQSRRRRKSQTAKNARTRIAGNDLRRKFGKWKGEKPALATFIENVDIGARLK